MPPTPLKAFTLGFAIAIANGAWAAPVSIDLPRQPLAQSLRQLAEQAHLSLAVDNRLVPTSVAPALRGTLEPMDALSQLLQGTGLEYQLQGNTIVITAGRGDALELSATNINGVGEGLGSVTEGSDSYTVRSTGTATKLPLTLRETPQSVTVIPRQVMTDHNLTSLDDVVKFTPGLSSNHRDSERYTFYSRGFQIQNFEYDGIPSQIVNESQQFTSTLLDMAMYDRVEVVRGATGLLSGAGTPSATLNLVRKRPTSDFQGYVAGEAGAWDRYRSEADVSGPLTETGNIRGRLVGVYETANSFIDWYKTDKRMMYGALDIDLSEDTLLRLSLDYQNNNSDGVSFGHIPLFNTDGSATHFSRSFNPGARWSYLDNTHYNFTSLLEQKLANDWSLKASYSHQYSYRRGVTGSASRGSPDPSTGSGVSMYINRLDSYQTQDTADVYATGPFTLGGREHELVVGGNLAYTHLNYPTYESMNPVVDDIYNWDGDPNGKPHLSKTDESISRLMQSGLYTAVRLKPYDPLSIILGTRVSWWKQRDGASTETPDATTQKSGVVTPYAGVILDLDEHYSLYASYTNIFLPQTYYKTANGSSLDPLEGDNYEIGIKGEFFDGALNTSLALFEVKQENTPEYVGINEDSGEEIYRAIAGTTTRGVEAEVSGRVARGWDVMGGYTYRESHDNDDNRVEANQPMNLFKLATRYRLPGEWERLTLGGNIVWQSDIYAVSSSGTKAHQRPFGVVGLVANYEVSHQLTLGLNLNNLFDKKYYDGLSTFNSGSYGEPRNAVMNARWSF